MWVQKILAGVTHVAYSSDGRTLHVLDTTGWLTAWDIHARTATRILQFVRDGAWRIHPLIPLAGGRLLNRASGFVMLDSTGKILADVNLTPGRAGYEHITPDGVVYYPEE